MGIDEDASIDEIRGAYRKAVERLHPLKCQDIIESDGVMRWKLSQAFLRIVEAFSTLSRPARRIEYDAKLSQKPTAPLPIPPIRDTPLTRDQRTAGHGGDSHRLALGNVSGKREEMRKVSDRRRAVRLALRLPVHVTNGANSELTESFDVSRSGIRFRLSRQAEIGTKLALVLPMPGFLRAYGHSDRYYSVAAVVRHASRSGEEYIVGAEFVTATDSPLPAASPDVVVESEERRAARRINHLCQIECEQGGGAPINTWMTDLSTEGAFVNCAASLEVGSRLKLKFRLLVADILVTAVVRRRTSFGVGITFLDLGREHRATIESVVTAAELDHSANLKC
jgi:curved DNA-binding protein CbpA